jgi:hypothetical protein
MIALCKAECISRFEKPFCSSCSYMSGSCGIAYRLVWLKYFGKLGANKKSMELNLPPGGTGMPCNE